jgi:ribonucleotide monophosphatase NagD (HAD superfamily)
MDYFHNTDGKEGLRDIRADQIAIVGDRLLTDMCLANEMGSWGVWVKDGVVDLKSKSVVGLISSRSSSAS